MNESKSYFEPPLEAFYYNRMTPFYVKPIEDGSGEYDPLGMKDSFSDKDKKEPIPESLASI